MISDQLFDTLVQRKIIGEETAIEAEYDMIDFSQRGLHKTDVFTIDLMFKNPDTQRYFFRLSRKEDHKVITATCDQILTIDGMTPKLLAKAYNLKETGDKVKLGKRRGRPRKQETIDASNPLLEPDYATSV